MRRVVILPVLLLLVGLMQAQTMKKVAVFDPEGNVVESIKHIVREEISNAIVNTPNYAVVERSMIEKVLAESKFQSEGLVDDSQISELGRMMGADYVCYGSIAGIGNNYYISLKMVDVITARVMLQRTGTTEEGMKDLISLVEGLAYQLVNKTGRTKEEIENTKKKSNRSKYKKKGSGEIVVVSIRPEPNDAIAQKIANNLVENLGQGYEAMVLPAPLGGSVNKICKRTKEKYNAKYVALITFTHSSRTYYFQAELFDTDIKERMIPNVEKSVRVKNYTIDKLADEVWKVYEGALF